MISSSTPTRWSALVVDDEPLAREGVRMLLAAENDVENVLEARNGPEAVALIRCEKPDIVFLDVQMPEMNGFEVLQEIGPDSMPVVVFVTAHDQYAIKAFEINAIDYLLKPVTRQRFKEALRRATDRLRSPSTDERVLSMLQTLALPRKYMTRIAVRSGGKTYFVELAEVDWMQAAENYVQLHTANAKHLVHVPIQTLQDSIDPDRFLRIHRSLIVNLQQVKEIEPASHGESVLVLNSGVRLQSSRTYSDAIRRWANNPF
jgi:two-component system, LytTR family, response regulator